MLTPGHGFVDGMMFSTYDKDNDVYARDVHGVENCAEYYEAGWWHNSCKRSLLNGVFRPKAKHQAAYWDSFGDVTFTEMKLRQI